MKRIQLFILALLFPLITSGQAGRKYYVERSRLNGELIGKVETGIGSGVFVTTPVQTLRALGLTPGTVAIPKPVDRNFTAVNRTYNLRRNGSLNLPNLTFVDYLRRTDFTLSEILTRQDFFSHQGVLTSEQNDANVWRRAYFELSGGALGSLEGSRPFFLATTQQVLNQLAATSMGINKAVQVVVTNFETCYALFPTSEAAVIAAYGPLTQTIVIEQEGAQKGQTMTLGQVWAQGANFFHAEERQRFTNRHVAINLWLKALVPGAKVANGDGVNVYYQRSPVFDYGNEYDSFANGSNPGNYFFTTTANQPTLTAGGLMVTPAGKTFWDTQDWINNYIYPLSHRLPAADFDALAAAGPTPYSAVWPKLKPDIWRYDAGIVAFDFINRKKIPGKPYVLQTHYRDENGYVKEGTSTTSKFFSQLSDEAVCPPWHHYAVAAWTAFLGQSKNDRLTVWRTFRVFPTGGPTTSGSPDFVYNRPHADREAYDAGLSAIGKFSEYLTGGARRFYPHDLYVKYPGLSGGGWGASAVTINGYTKRSIRDIVFADNPSDRRTKAVVGMRTIVKNGSVWALIVGTNWGQEANDVTTIDLLIRKAEVPELAADVEVTGLKIDGYGMLIAEVCLEPARLSSLVSGGTSTTTPAGVDPDFDYFGFPFTALPPAVAPSNKIIAVTSGSLRVEMRTDYGGAITGVKPDGTNNLINNFDHGRQMPVSSYSDPFPFNVAGYYKPSPWEGFPLNPLETGDWAGNPSEFLQYGFDAPTGTVFTRVRANNFPMVLASNGGPYRTGTIYDKWVRPISPGVVRVWYRITHNRNNDDVPARNPDGSLVRSRGQAQEFPIGYVNDAYTLLSYDAGNGSVTTKDLSNSSNWIQSLPIAGNWLHVGNGSLGFGIVGRHITSATGRIDLPGASGGVDGARTTYFANLFGLNPDPVGTVYTCYDIVAGSAATVKAYAEGLNAIRPNGNLPDYSFSAHRRGFWTQNATLNDENTTLTGGELVVTHINQQARLYSPTRPFAASGVSTLYVRMRNDSPVTALQLGWRKPGQSEGDAAAQTINFSCPNDGNYHTVAINVGANGAWSGQISYFVIGQQVAPENSPVTGRAWRVKYIGRNNPPNN